MDELKKCPWCASDMIAKMRMPNGYVYYCQGCGKSGPMENVEGSALFAWNYRPLEDALTAEVARLRERVAELEAEAAWVSVKERLPEVADKCSCPVWAWVKKLGHGWGAEMIYIPEDWIGLDYLYRRGWYYRGKSVPIEDDGYSVTHWRPLPNPPEAE